MSRKMSVSQQQSRQEWIDRLRDWYLSGMSQSKYCRDNGLNLRNFQYRKKNLFRLIESEPIPQEDIQPVKIVEINKEKLEANQFNLFNESSQMKLKINNVSVELNNHFSEQALLKLIRVLNSV